MTKIKGKIVLFQISQSNGFVFIFEKTKNMRTLIAAFILFFINTSVFAQQNFEGRIIYKYSESTNNKTGSIEAFFGNKKIKAHITDSSKGETKDDILIDFEKGVAYSIDIEKKYFTTDSFTNKRGSLFPSLTLAPEKNKIIKGYHCSAYIGNDSVKREYREPTNVTTWVADSLYFFFDNKYANPEMIPVFGDGKNIAMGFEIKMTLKGQPVMMKSVPVLIEYLKMPDSFFTIPSGYTFGKSWGNVSNSTTIDSTINFNSAVEKVMDSAKKMMDKAKEAADRVNEKRKKSTHKKPSSKNTHNQPTKSSAIKPKE